MIPATASDIAPINSFWAFFRDARDHNNTMGSANNAVSTQNNKAITFDWKISGNAPRSAKSANRAIKNAEASTTPIDINLPSSSRSSGRWNAIDDTVPSNTTAARPMPMQDTRKSRGNNVV